jgi:hypothetical protein
MVLACGYDSRSSVDDNNFREDVISCEDALAKLEGCCPDFRPNAVRCHYSEIQSFPIFGCTPREGLPREHEEPALSLAASQCILDLSCPELVDKGVCRRAQAAKPYVNEETASDPAQSKSHPPVCP